MRCFQKEDDVRLRHIRCEITVGHLNGDDQLRVKYINVKLRGVSRQASKNELPDTT